MADRCEKHERFILEGGCPAKAFEEAIVTVPVEVRAFADIGDVDLHCVGDPVITRNSDCAPGCPGAVSKFTIKQKLRVDVPILFGAECNVGEGHVVYAPVTTNDLDTVIESDAEIDACGCRCNG